MVPEVYGSQGYWDTVSQFVELRESIRHVFTVYMSSISHRVRGLHSFCENFGHSGQTCLRTTRNAMYYP